MGGACLNLLAGIDRMPWFPRHYLILSGTGHLILLTNLFCPFCSFKFLILIGRHVTLDA